MLANQREDEKYFFDIQKNLEKSINNLKIKVHKKEKIKVAFIYMYSSSCQTLSVFEKVLEENNIFDPYFIVNPDVLRSSEHADHYYKQTKSELTKKYGQNRVLDGYRSNTGEYTDYTSEFDIATTNNPYDCMAQDYFKIEYWATKNIPIFYASYFYMGRCYVSIENFKMRELNLLWKIFAENDFVYKQAKQHQIIKGKNITVTGYPKMDKLAAVIPARKSRKQIIIAPHHTIDSNETSVGGFLQYCDIILEFPSKFKDIDFIFRPHPLLFENLRHKYWGNEKADKYLHKLLSNNNVSYSSGGEYMELFANSDALIHDCGSFSAEYLYTGKPCAYIYKKGINPDLRWTDFGRACLNSHYKIEKQDDFETFIENVVINGNDCLKKSREEFAKQHVMINYPHSTDIVLDYIKNELDIPCKKNTQKQEPTVIVN